MERLTGSDMNRLTVATMQVEALRKQAADAQATIAALQARVQELKDAEKTYQGILRQAYTVQNDLTQRTAELQTARCDAVRAFVRGEDKMCLVCGAKEPCELNNDPSSPCTFEPTPMELLKALQQRTAELEAARGERDRALELRDRWQAQLDKEQADSFMRNIELVKLRALILALPKVEGEILEQGDFAFVRYAHVDGPLPEIPRREQIALLQHRQGMEG